MKQRIMTVGKLTRYIKTIFDNDPILRNVLVEGEISNFKLHSSGHAYFSIKDNEGRMSCVMFRHVATTAPFLKDGDQVVLRGSVSIYEKTGQYQLYVQHCEAKGQGDLYLEFEQLKLELGAMGWFDADKKKPIPLFPHVIGIVTSPTGAVIQDMINVITRRFPRVEIQLYPVAVQGDRAAEEISRAIDVFNDRKEVDVIIVGRGGGSIEELWAFNEKQVAESIHRSILPVISAVGHETDFTIADFVADLRAPTPSAAGELAVPSTAELKQQLHQFKRRLTTDMNTKLAHRREGLGRLRNSYFFARPDMFFAQNVQQLDVLKGQLLDKMNQRRILARAQLQEHRLKLEGIDPNTILQRGYAAVKNMDGHYVTGPDQLETGDRIQLIFATGTADAAITGKGTKTP